MTGNSTKNYQWGDGDKVRERFPYSNYQADANISHRPSCKLQPIINVFPTGALLGGKPRDMALALEHAHGPDDTFHGPSLDVKQGTDEFHSWNESVNYHNKDKTS